MDINEFVKTHDQDKILIDLSLAQLGFESPVLEDPRYADMNILQIIKIIDQAIANISSDETLKIPHYYELVGSRLAKTLKINADKARDRLHKFQDFKKIPKKIYPTNASFGWGVFAISAIGIGIGSFSGIFSSLLGMISSTILISGSLFALTMFAILKQHKHIDKQISMYDYSFKNLTYENSRSKIINNDELSAMTFSEMKETAESIDRGMYNSHSVEEYPGKIEENIIDKINAANDAKILDNDQFNDLGRSNMHFNRSLNKQRRIL